MPWALKDLSIQNLMFMVEAISMVKHGLYILGEKCDYAGVDIH